MLRAPENSMLEIGSHSVAQMLDLVGSPETSSLRVHASNPVELPSGRPFFRRWKVEGLPGAAALAAAAVPWA